MEGTFNIGVFVLFLCLWIAFAAALVLSQGSLDATWAWIGQQNIVVQGIVWLLFLPVVAGLWVWESGWPELVRLAIIGGLAFVNLYLFFPKATAQG
jgi:hypothetical protein